MTTVIVTGTPGSGKTSLSRLLAARDPRGVHLRTDVFFDFVAHRKDPSLPEGRDEVATVVNAYTSAGAQYVAGGYSVYLDGVIGPWLLPRITPALGTFDYVLLHVPLDVALSRTAGRRSQPSANPDVVRRMHALFVDVLESYRSHVIETKLKTVEQVADEFAERRRRGEFILR